jgi:predicted nucleotidyltransferase
MNDKIIEKIEEYFIDKSEVIAVYLYGSYASGKERHFSDLDIGFLLDRTYIDDAEKKKYEYMVELSRLLRKDIHPIILNFAGEELVKQILIKGKCILVNNPKELAQYKMVMFSKIADFAYYREQMQSGLIKSIMET